MNRTVRSAIVLVVGGTVASLLAPACVEYPQSIVVTRVIPPEADDKGRCIVTAGGSGPGLINGVLDIAVARGYIASLEITNQLRAAKDDSKARVETGSVNLLGASVRLTFVNGEALSSSASTDGRDGNEFRTEGSGFLPPAGKAPITVTLLDSAAINVLRERLKRPGANGQPAAEQVLAFARVQAQTLGGLTVESQEFQFPITVCSKCLVDFPAPAAGDACPAPAVTATPETAEIVCNPGQDSRVPCSQCTSFSEYCRTRL